MNPKSICVVGGGTAGLIAAIILKRRLDIEVSVIYSSSIGIIGVGEGSTEHWKEFMDFVGIDQQTLIKECDATYKSGIMFENWGEQPFLHAVGLPFVKKFSQYSYIYANQISKKSNYISPSNLWHSKINQWFLTNPTEFPANQFHFNTQKLNNFLMKLADKFNITLIDDEIEDVLLDGTSGFIRSLKGKKSTYTYDFYIDSTGFKRLLIDKMGAKWQSYKKYLKMKSAIVFPTGDEENYNMWTLAKAMNYGWRFKIPVWGRHGNGYIYDSDYTTADQAKQEVESELGKEIEVSKHFNFDPGALDKAWIKNCVAIGLSGSFVEPLEASSIGTSIQQAFLLMHRLPNYNEQVINSYNKSFNDIMINIRDFIVLHYQTKKTNTDFWKDASNLELPDSLQSKLEIWKYKLPIAEDFNDRSDYIMFTAANHIMILDGLDMFDRGAIQHELDMHYPYIKEDADNAIQCQLNLENTTDFITHKNYLAKIKF
jgi:flavin-dependent dehydrogenase